MPWSGSSLCIPSPGSVERGRHVAADRDRPDFTVKHIKMHKRTPSTNRPRLVVINRNEDVYHAAILFFQLQNPNRQPHK
jgi:hypothetical protein